MDKNVLGILSIYLGDVNSLKILSIDISNILFEIESQESYWHAKLSELLGYPLTNKIGSWREMYENLSKLKAISPLYVIQFDYPEIMQHFIDDGWNFADAPHNIQREAAKHNSVKSLELILDNITNIDMVELLGFAIIEKSYDVIKLLINREVELDDMTLTLAVRIGDVKIVELLLQQSKILKLVKTSDSIITAAGSGYEDIVKLLLENGAKRNDNINVALRCALENGHESVVKLLLQYYSPNDPYYHYRQLGNSIMKAYAKGYLDIIEMVLEKYPKAVEYLDRYTSRGLISNFNRRGKVNMVNLLARYLKITKIFNKEEILSIFARIGSVDLVRSMFQVPNAHFSTSGLNLALSEAIRGGHVEIVKILLKTPGIDPSMHYAYNITVAKNKGYTDIFELLSLINK